LPSAPAAISELSADNEVALELALWDTTALGHEEQFSPPTLSARYGIRQETFAGTHGNGRDAPIPAVQEVAPEPSESDPLPTFAPTHEDETRAPSRFPDATYAACAASPIRAGSSYV
jgi:hypothetical protein